MSNSTYNVNNQSVLSTPAWSDITGWDQSQCYSTIQLADIDGDGQQELLGRSAQGLEAWKFDSQWGSWYPLAFIDTFSDKNGWDKPQYYQTIFCFDLDQDGQIEVIGRGDHGIIVFKYDPSNKSFNQVSPLAYFTNQDGWNQSPNYQTLRCARVSASTTLLLGLSAQGVASWSYNVSNSGNGNWASQANGLFNPWQGIVADLVFNAILVADFDGDGFDELAVGVGNGLSVYKFDDSSGQWQPLGTSSQLSLAGSQVVNFTNMALGNSSSYIVLAGDVDGDGQAEIGYRSSEGLLFYRYDPSKGYWAQAYTMTCFSDDEGWQKGSYAQTITCANLFNSKKLAVCCRGMYGCSIWRLNIDNDQWLRLLDPSQPGCGFFCDADGWNSDPYQSTLHWGNIDGSGEAKLVARAATGINSFSFDSTSTQFAPTLLPFPAFTGDEVAAYNAISQALLPVDKGNTSPPLRDQYNNMDITWADYRPNLLKKSFREQNIPSGVSKDVWKQVAEQLYNETQYLDDVKASYQNVQSLLNSLYASQTLTLISVSNQVQVSSDTNSSFNVATLLTSVLVVVADVASLGTATPVTVCISVGASMLSGVIATATSGQPLSLTGTISELSNNLNNQLNETIGAINPTFTCAANNWGSLAMLKMQIDQGGGMPDPDSTVATNPTINDMTTTALDVASAQYGLQLYQALMPIKYPLMYFIAQDTHPWSWGDSFDPKDSGAYVSGYVEKSGEYNVLLVCYPGFTNDYPPVSTMKDIFDKVQTAYRLDSLDQAAVKYFFGGISGMSVYGYQDINLVTPLTLPNNLQYCQGGLNTGSS